MKLRDDFSLLDSFKCAIDGIFQCIKAERNVKIHLTAGFVVLFMAFFLRITKIEFIIIVLLIGLVLTFEIFNTSIETTVDLVTREYQPLAKKAKDMAAGAVLMFSIFTAIIGGIIFLPYIINLIF